MSVEKRNPEVEPVNVFVDQVIVTPEMVDQYGNHLNHLATLAIFEDQRFKVFESVGIPRTGVMELFGFISVVRDLTAQYRDQAFLNDHLEVHSELYPRRYSMKFKHQLTKSGLTVAKSDVTLAVINNEGKLTRLPNEFYDLFKQAE